MKKSRYALPYEVWMVLFILVPILIVLYYACTTSQGGRVAFSLANLAQVFSPTYLAVLWRSLWIALVATVICLLIGYPVASILASRHFKRSSLMLMLIIIPMWMNFLIRTYAWMTILQDTGIFNGLLSALGLGTVHIIGTEAAVVIGMVYDYFPYMIIPIYSVMAKMDVKLIEAARDLGCNGLGVLRRVIWPLSLPGVISGVTMVLIPSVSTFYISQKLGDGKIMLIGDVIEGQYVANNLHFAAAIAFVLMVLLLVCMAVMRKLVGRNVEGGL